MPFFFFFFKSFNLKFSNKKVGIFLLSLTFLRFTDPFNVPSYELVGLAPSGNSAFIPIASLQSFFSLMIFRLLFYGSGVTVKASVATLRKFVVLDRKFSENSEPELGQRLYRTLE